MQATYGCSVVSPETKGRPADGAAKAAPPVQHQDAVYDPLHGQGGTCKYL